MITFCSRHTVITIILSILIGFGTFFSATSAVSAASCPLTVEEPADVFNYVQNDIIEFSHFQRQNGQAVITVTNNSDCDLPLALGSYKMMTGNELSEQTLHDEHTAVISPHSSHTLKVNLPSCMAQVDLYLDSNQNGVPTPPEPANPQLIGFTFSGNERDVFAENDILHFASDHPYNNLDDFPEDKDDSYRNAKPSDDSRYCDVPPQTCPYPNNRLPVEEPADIFNYVQNGTLAFSHFQKQNGRTTISVTNNSNCKFPVALGVYEMFDNTFENQQLFSQDTIVVNPNSQETVSAELPACMAQIDLLYDPNQDGPPKTPSSANPNLIGFTFNHNNKDVYAENDMLHFDSGHPYGNLDDFPEDEDDSPRNAGPAANFCPAGDKTKLTIIKKVKNRQSRSITPSDFSITATPNTGNSPAIQFPGSSDGTTRAAAAIRYNLNESGPNSVKFTTTYTGDCQAQNDGSGGQVTIQQGETATCTITNTLEDKPTPQPEPFSCPFTTDTSGGQYDHVVTFTDNGLRSDRQSASGAQTEAIPLNLGAGKYQIGMFAHDRGSSRKNQTQKFEQYFTRLFNSAGGYEEQSISTADLPDRTAAASTTRVTTVTLQQSVNRIQARHSAFFGKTGDDGSANSLAVGCIAVDKQADQTEPLSGSCSVSPDNPTPGQQVSWTSSASGGTGNYAFDWNGAVTANAQNTTTTYNSPGTKTATVTISDGENNVQKTCSVSVVQNSGGGDGGDNDGGGSGGGGDILEPRDDGVGNGQVRGEQDQDFSVQCTPENDTYLIGERVTYTVDVSGNIDEDEVSFAWSNSNNLDENGNEAQVQYLSAGTKSVTVTAQFDGQEEADTCRVNIRQATSRSGVRLSQVPYTGPADTARTVGFGLLLLFMALSGSYYAMQRLSTDTVHVGIPEDGKQK